MMCSWCTFSFMIDWACGVCDRPKWPLLHWKTRPRSQALWEGEIAHCTCMCMCIHTYVYISPCVYKAGWCARQVLCISKAK